MDTISIKINGKTHYLISYPRPVSAEFAENLCRYCSLKSLCKYPLMNGEPLCNVFILDNHSDYIRTFKSEDDLNN